MSLPTLSVCMTNHNHARFLPQALDAILSQSCPPMEVLVMDDASTDDSVKVLEGFARKSPLVRVMRNEQKAGVLANMNRMLGMAKGDCWYGAAADDVILPGLFEKSLTLLADHPDAGLCSSLAHIMNEEGVRQGLISEDPFQGSQSRYLTPQEVRCAMSRHPSWIQGLTTIHRRARLVEMGGFPVELGSYSDGFVAQVLARRHGACFISEPLASWRRMEGGFADGTTSDWRRLIGIRDSVVPLMRGTFRDAFTEDDIRCWKRRWEIVGFGAFTRRQALEWRRAASMLLDGRPDPSSLVARIACGIIWGAASSILLLGLFQLKGAGAFPILVNGWLAKLGKSSGLSEDRP